MLSSGNVKSFKRKSVKEVRVATSNRKAITLQ